MSYNEQYYKGKQEKLTEKFQVLQNESFTAFIQLAANFFNTKAEIESELEELNKLIESNTMFTKEDEQVDAVASDAAEVADEAVVAEPEPEAAE